MKTADKIEMHRARARNALANALRDWWDSGDTDAPGEWCIRAHPAALGLTHVTWCPDLVRPWDGSVVRDTDYGRFVLLRDEACEPWTEFHIERRRYHVEGVL